MLCVLIMSGALLATRPPVDELIAQGIKLREERKDEQAIELFRRAYEGSQAARALAQLALAESALGRWLQAETHLRMALDATEDRWITGNRELLLGALRLMQQHLGDVEISCPTIGAEVKVNNVVVGEVPLGRPVRAQVGSAVLEISAPGYWPLTRTVLVPAGGLIRESFTLTPRSPEPVSPLPVAVQPSAAPVPWALVSGLGATAALTAGIAGTIARYSLVAEADELNRTGQLEVERRCGGALPDARCPSLGASTALQLGGMGLGIGLVALTTWLMLEDR